LRDDALGRLYLIFLKYFLPTYSTVSVVALV
jgi:hypothetical protein